MADDTITVTYKVNDDGSLERISKKANAAASATDKASNASSRYNKQQKGVAGATSNSTKAFSKMTTGITGGLVPAYAALAANVFAISAAFNFFKRAADVKILEEGQIAFGKNTGFALQTVTAGLREASGGMLGFREAAEAAAIGVAKGFSPKQLNDLAVGARKASAALGRNFEDSFDRLIRGASKAEPELLDELGITLKLADATKAYGDAIGKNADDLTAFERSQAVLIETQRQLDAMYGEMGESTNPFVKLSKTFDDLVKAGTNFLLPIFEGLAKIINGSAVAAVAVFGALGVSILKTMIPMGGIKESLEEFQMNSEHATANAINDQMDYQAELKRTEAALKASRAQSVQSAAKSIGGPSKLVQKAAAGNLTDPKQIGQLKSLLDKAEAEYRTHGEIRKGIFKGADLAQIKSLKGALDTMGRDHLTFFQRQKMHYKSVTLSAKVYFAKVRAMGTRAFTAVGKAATKMGSAINKAMRLAGFIGMFMMIIELGEQLMNAPMSIVMGILKGVDAVIKGGMIGLGMLIDGVRNMWAKTYNTIVGMINAGAEWLGFSAPIATIDENSRTATDAMSNLAAETISVADSFESSSWGKGLQGFQDRRQAAQAEAEAYDRLKESIESVGEEIESLAEGLAGQTGAKKETSAATALGTLGISAQMRKVLGTKDEDRKANAIKMMRREYAGLANISQEAFDAMNQMDEDGLKKILSLETSAQGATGGLAAMQDSIRGINSALSSGNLLEAELALEALSSTSNDTSTAFKALFGNDSAAAKKALADFEKAFSGANMTSSQFLQKLKDLRVAQEALKASQAKASLVQGQFAKTFQLKNDLAQADLNIQTKNLELEKEKDPVRRKQIEQELELLRIAKEKANIALIGETQGAGMAAAAASDVLADQGLQAQMSPMLAQLEKLGPEGELISSVVNGAFAIQEAFSTAFEEIGEDGLTMETALSTAATAAQTIGGILESSSKNKIANINQEIAAEKKRDGKSKESQARIAALERKKVETEKKSFEQQKKMKMAMVVMSTASAIMKEAEKGFPAAIPGMALFAALGAAQLKVIAGSSYQGGGAGSAPSAPAEPSAISMGSRNNKVDISSGRGNAAGELAYLRGARGSGSGAHDFRPAFAGARYRAGGGYVVGEQGPELFMPGVPGQIIPSGRGAGGQTSVNFTINAVDAAGIEEVLVSQRGNIIGMIRESANEYGTDFLEDVETEVYTATTEGTVYGRA